MGASGVLTLDTNKAPSERTNGCGLNMPTQASDGHKGATMVARRQAEHEIQFTINVKTYGVKERCVRMVGQTLAKMLYLSFGDKFTLTDHRNRVVAYDPKAHDWGFGET